MRLQLLYFDNGNLFAGFGLRDPLLTWNAQDKVWNHLPSGERREEGWAQRIAPSAAERCYPGSLDSASFKDVEVQREFSTEDAIRLRPDLFDDYDFRSIKK